MQGEPVTAGQVAFLKRRHLVRPPSASQVVNQAASTLRIGFTTHARRRIRAR